MLELMVRGLFHFCRIWMVGRSGSMLLRVNRGACHFDSSGLPVDYAVPQLFP